MMHKTNCYANSLFAYLHFRCSVYHFYKKLSQSAVLTDWESLGCYAFASRVVASVFLAARRYSTLAAVLYLL